MCEYMNEPNNDEKIKFQPLSLAGGPESGPCQAIATGLRLGLQDSFSSLPTRLFFSFCFWDYTVNN